MALESTPNQSFLGDDADDDFAALDSMAFTGTQSQSQFGMNTVTPSVSSGSSFGGGSNHDTNMGQISNGKDGGFTGVSESLFDRIRARTAEQQKQSMASAQYSQVPPSQQPPSQQPPPPPGQEAAQSSQQSAFMSHPQPTQPSSESTMDFENDLIGMGGNNNNAFGNTTGAGMGAPPQNNHAMNSNNETTYSFSANAGEDFSQAAPAPHVPQYGPSRDDPYYAATSNQPQQYPTSIQDKASMALVQTGETVKSLFGAGLSGAQAIGAMAQEKMGVGRADGGGSGGGRSYNNNFLLREDTLEEGNNNMMNHSAAMSQPPPPVPAAVAAGSEAGVSGQAYSMFSYGKTFCEDLFGFFMSLPHWGKAIVTIILLWMLYAFFDII